MLTATVLILWAASIYRAWLSWSQKRVLWRTSFTVSMFTVAAALTIYRFRVEIDQAFGLVNVSSLASRLVETVSLLFLLVYLHALRSDTVPTNARRLYGGLTAIVAVLLTLSWIAAPVHDQETSDFLFEPVSVGVAVYCMSFWFFLAIALSLMAVTCVNRRRALRHRDHARSVSLLLSGAGSIIGLVAVGGWSLSLLLIFNGVDGAAPRRLGDSLMPVSAGLVGLGVICLLVVPFLLAIVVAVHRSRRLSPLWTDMVDRFPQVHLNVHPTGPPLSRLQFRVERMIIEIRDALRVAPVARPPAGGSPVDAVARSIRRGESDGSVRASDVLMRPESRDADLAQLLSLAAAYRRSDDAPT